MGMGTGSKGGKGAAPSTPSEIIQAPTPIAAPSVPQPTAPPQTEAPAPPVMEAPLPDTPDTEPTEVSTDVDERQEAEKKKRMQKQGRSSTILTDPLDEYLEEDAGGTLLSVSTKNLKA